MLQLVHKDIVNVCTQLQKIIWIDTYKNKGNMLLWYFDMILKQ